SFPIFHFMEPDVSEHERVDPSWSPVRMALALTGSLCFVLLVAGAQVVHDIESQAREVLSVYQDKSLIEILSPKRKHNPIDDFVLTTPETKAVPITAGA